ncbi:uncharacterized protein [Littorina saxatilis]|uniref:uncharacterized protein n=1 Tax=Littorina saxatilis TaxID=31220 RepID=UPI0038B50DC8
MSPSLCPLLLLLVLHTVLHIAVCDEDGEGEEKRAFACYGTSHNFLDINCPQGRQVALVSMMDGAKRRDNDCPGMTTNDEMYREDCCTFSEGDCVIATQSNQLPTECNSVHFCRPQARLASTGPTCNKKDFPEFTHYTEIKYRCIVPLKETTTTTTSTTTTRPPINVTNITVTSSNSSTSNTTSTLPYTVHKTQKVKVGQVTDTDSDDFTPAIVGGMMAGIVGLLLTVFIFMFYWGRKRQVRISGKNQTSVWDFLLANSMSVRAFRGYDNFSSSRQSVSSEDGSPVARKTVWLPNISLDSGHGESALTSDDNCSVVTLEHAARRSSFVGAGLREGAGLRQGAGTREGAGPRDGAGPREGAEAREGTRAGARGGAFPGGVSVGAVEGAVGGVEAGRSVDVNRL